MAVCAVSWGLVAMAMAGLQTAQQFYCCACCWVFAEGGLAPGVVLYLSQFATERERATTFALPMLAVPLSIVLGGHCPGG